MPGLLIALEGGEAVGKTTQYERLVEGLRASGHDVVATREPGGTANAEELRGLFKTVRATPYQPLTELFIIMAARAEHLAGVVRPALAAGRTVVTDRFVDSTLVYQGMVRGLGDAFVQDLHERSFAGAVPDLTIVLDVPVEVALRRMTERLGCAQDAFDRESADFHEAVRQGYLALARRRPERYLVVDASGTPDEVTAAIQAGLAAWGGAGTRAPAPVRLTA